MSKRHKRNRNQSKAQQVSQHMAETERYDRRTVSDDCLDWQEYFRLHGDMEEANVAWAWAMWCETAPANLFNQVCDKWAAWTAQQTHNSAIKQGELL